MSKESNVDEEQQERRFRCSYGFRTGWFDSDDAIALAEIHSTKCDGEIEYKEREKEGTNYSDYPLGPTKECDKCGSENVTGQEICAVCGRPIVNA